MLSIRTIDKNGFIGYGIDNLKVKRNGTIDKLHSPMLDLSIYLDLKRKIEFKNDTIISLETFIKDSYKEYINEKIENKFFTPVKTEFGNELLMIEFY